MFRLNVTRREESFPVVFGASRGTSTLAARVPPVPAVTVKLVVMFVFRPNWQRPRLLFQCGLPYPSRPTETPALPRRIGELDSKRQYCRARSTGNHRCESHFPGLAGLIVNANIGPLVGWRDACRPLQNILVDLGEISVCDKIAGEVQVAIDPAGVTIQISIAIVTGRHHPAFEVISVGP